MIKIINENTDNNIIQVKISGKDIAINEQIEQLEKEYSNDLERFYNLKFCTYDCDYSSGFGYEIIKGKKEDIENYLLDIYETDLNDKERIEISYDCKLW